MKLYEINAEITKCVDVETGEIIDFDRLEELQIRKAEKIENIGCWIKNLTATASALKTEEDTLSARRKAAENKVKQLKEYLSEVLGGEMFETPKVKISFRRSEALDFTEGAQIPEGYLKIKMDVDKAGLKKAIKSGLEFDGIQVIERQNIQIK